MSEQSDKNTLSHDMLRIPLGSGITRAKIEDKKMEVLTEYKYIYFKQKLANTIKTSVWGCYNSHIHLGDVRWYGSWRQYCFYPEANTVFNVGCMKDINDFIGQQMQARQAELAKRKRGEQ